MNKFYCRGHATGSLRKIESIFFRRGVPPIKIASLLLDDWDQKFIVRYTEDWDQLDMWLCQNHYQSVNVTCGISLQLYKDRKNKTKVSAAIFNVQKSVTIDWGTQIEFYGQVMEDGDVGGDFLKLDVSQNKFPCFSVLQYAGFPELTSGMIVRGNGLLNKKEFNFADEKESVTLPYVDVKDILEVN
jgi:hypothetical protein